MSQEKIKVGLVGYGRLGKAYAQNLKKYIPNADLIAVCSLVEDEILHARHHLQVPYVYSSYEKMLEHTELDAIYVVSSTDQHANQVMLALESGKHVFSEKPLAIDIETCKEVLVH